MFQSFEPVTLKPLLGEKLFHTLNSATPTFSLPPATPSFSLPPTPILTTPTADSSMFSSWPVVGVETTVPENQFNFGIPSTPLALAPPPEPSTQPFGFNYGMSPFYTPSVPAYCACAECLGMTTKPAQPSLDMTSTAAYHGAYSSDDSPSSLHKSAVSSAPQPKEEPNRQLSVITSQYPSRDSTELDSDAQFDLQRYYSNAAANVSSETSTNCGSNEDYMTSSAVAEKRIDHVTSDANVDSASVKAVSQKSSYPSDTRTPFAALTNENIDYYASMNSFPNTSSSATLFPSYSNRAVIGAGDGALINFNRSVASDSQRAPQISLAQSAAGDPPQLQQQTSMVMYNNAASSYAALPYMSWSQGEPLMVPTLYNPNNSLDVSPYATGSQPLQGAPNASQSLFPMPPSKDKTGLGVGGHDEHNPDYSSCFSASSAPGGAAAGSATVVQDAY